MGGQGGSLAAALIYSNVVFAGAIPLWLYNSLAAVIRGTGNMWVPASVTAVGAAILIPLSPVLIFGLGPVPAFGIAGGAAAVLAFYVAGSRCVCMVHLVGARRVASVGEASRLPLAACARHPENRRAVIRRQHHHQSHDRNRHRACRCLRSGGRRRIRHRGTAGISAGAAGIRARRAGRLDGRHQYRRRIRTSAHFALPGPVPRFQAGLPAPSAFAAAIFPEAWLSLFGDDATMNAVGAQYLRIVGPFYGFFGIGLSLYFASQGAGRVGWAMGVALLRVAIAALGGFAMVRFGAGTAGIFAALAAGLAIYGILNIVAVAAGVWFRDVSRRRETRSRYRGRDDKIFISRISRRAGFSLPTSASPSMPRRSRPMPRNSIRSRFISTRKRRRRPSSRASPPAAGTPCR